MAKNAHTLGVAQSIYKKSLEEPVAPLLQDARNLGQVLLSSVHDALLNIHFKAHQGPTGYQQIEKDWLQLAHSLGEDCAFQHHPYWYLSFLESGAVDPASIWFITAHENNCLLAVFPLQYQNYRLGIFRPRLLGTIEDDQLQLCDFVFAKEEKNANLFVQWLSWLQTQKQLPWDALRLRKVRDDSAIAFSASHVLPADCEVLQHDASNYFDTSVNFDHATKAMSRDFRRNVRRHLRRAQEAHTVRLEIIHAPADVDPAFQHFLEIEASGWKGQQGQASAIYCQPALLGFYQSLVNHFGSKGQCVINLLWFDDQAIAAQFCLKIGSTLHFLKLGYNEAFAKYAPGNVLLFLMLEQACLNPQTNIVSLVNAPLWSQRFKPLSMGLCSYFMPHQSVRGKLLLLGLHIKRAIDRRRLKKSDKYIAEKARRNSQS